MGTASSRRAPGAPIPILFTHYGEDWIRGSERCLLDLLAHLDPGRFRPVVWCNAPSLEREVARLGLPVHRSRFSILFNWERPRWDLRGYLHQVAEGRRLVRHYGIRVLHCNGGAPAQWLVPVGCFEHRPVLVHLHAPYVERDRFLLLLHQATLAVGVTQGCLQGLLMDGMPPGRTRTIYNGLDLTAWSRGEERTLRQRLGIRPGDVVITQVGSLIHRKGIDVMLRVFARLRRTRPQCHLVIVGDGPERPLLEQLRDDLGLQQAAHFMGFLPNAGAVLRDVTDILASPSRGEGFGLTVIEAGAAGLPVLATNTTGMDEIVTSGHNGLIVPIEDQEAMLSALLTLVDSADLRHQYGQRLRQTVHERFLISRNVSEFSRTYQELARVPCPSSGVGDGRMPWAAYWRWAGRVLGRKVAPRRTS